MGAFYEQLADKLVQYRTRQKEVIAFLEQLRSKGLTISSLEDRDAAKQRVLVDEIDPFTFVGVFNRGIANDMRSRIADAMKSFFGLEAAVPTDYAGIPVLNNMKSWFVSWKAERGRDDVDRLWEVFSLALGNDPMIDPRFEAAFTRALEVKHTNINLTMGLFWIRPKRFVSLDSTMRAYLHIDLPKDGLTFTFYRSTLKNVLAANPSKPIPELSHAAWLAAQKPTNAALPSNVEYWLVGAFWDSRDPPDQTKRFLEEGIWQNGYGDRKFSDAVRSMKPGDRIAIKAVATQTKNLPFDSRGETVSRLTIKARGTIVANRNDGKTVEVEWEPNQKDRDWYFYTARHTVWHLKKDEDWARHLIEFVFLDKPQDYKFFVDHWYGEEAAEGERDVQEGERAAPPYGVADMLSEGVFLDDDTILTALRRLEAKKLLILEGAPGVGKTFVARKLAYALMNARDDAPIESVQFHPSFSYEDFIRGYRPTEDAGRFALRNGPFTKLCARAEQDPDGRYVMLIDEINRGHLSQIFGELFMLLESDKRGKQHAVTPLYGESKFHVPENLYVIGTMNIADRSLALVDFALRRRFAFITLEPRFDKLREWLVKAKMPETTCTLIVNKMNALNERIRSDKQLGPAFRVGHSFFCPRGVDFSELDDSWYREIVETEVSPLLREYWYDAPDKAEAAVRELLA